MVWCGWAFEPRVQNVGDLRVAFEKMSDRQTALLMAFHTQRQRAQAAQQQPRRVRIQHAAAELDFFPQAFAQRGSAPSDDAGDDVAVAALRYFVALCSTRSIPRSSGVQNTGLAQELSNMVVMPRNRASAVIGSIAGTSKRPLVGLSR